MLTDRQKKEKTQIKIHTITRTKEKAQKKLNLLIPAVSKLECKIEKINKILIILQEKLEYSQARIQKRQEDPSTRMVSLPDCAKAIIKTQNSSEDYIKELDQQVSYIPLNEINHIGRYYGYARVIENPTSEKDNTTLRLRVDKSDTDHPNSKSVLLSTFRNCERAITGNRRSLNLAEVPRYEGYTKTVELELFYRILYLGCYATKKDFSQALDFPRFITHYHHQIPEIIHEARQIPNPSKATRYNNTTITEKALRFYIRFQDPGTTTTQTPILLVQTTPTTDHFAYYTKKSENRNDTQKKPNNNIAKYHEKRKQQQ